MKNFVLVIASVFIFSCSTDGNQSEDIANGSVNTVADLDTCQCHELKQSNGDWMKNDLLFTGVCIENYPETDLKYIEKNFLSGKLHGKVNYYDKNGGLLLEELYENGKSVRSGNVDNLECNCSELVLIQSSANSEVKRYSLDNIPFTGKCFEYYPNSDQLYIQAYYKNGALDGYTTYFGRDGKTLYMEKYSSGELINTVHE